MLCFPSRQRQGLIKIRGDRCWRDLTCMDFHYETQPVPNPVAYFLHRSPWWFHRFETLSNHFLELVVPFFIFLGRRMCIVHGALQVLFQGPRCPADHAPIFLLLGVGPVCRAAPDVGSVASGREGTHTRREPVAWMPNCWLPFALPIENTGPAPEATRRARLGHSLCGSLVCSACMLARVTATQHFQSVTFRSVLDASVADSPDSR
ncbi:hypothetical protein K5549_010643 [Capra hircus]|nr:hypothetical protein K5549_010643 [Capra hircus]